MDRTKYQREYVQKNRQRVAFNNWKRREDQRRALLELVGQSKCKDCGETDIRTLEFDHIKPKTATVGRLLGKCWKAALEEAQKCEVVCASCHSIRTYERRPKPPEVETVWIRRSKDECPKGHPKTDENTYVNNGKRFCRVCRAEASKQRDRSKNRRRT